MDVILKDLHLDTRTKRCILLNVHDRTKARVCRRSLGWKQAVGGEVGNSANVSGKKDTRMFENNEQYSIESRVGKCTLSKQTEA